MCMKRDSLMHVWVLIRRAFLQKGVGVLGIAVANVTMVIPWSSRWLVMEMMLSADGFLELLQSNELTLP
jgi:hypothetical protein